MIKYKNINQGEKYPSDCFIAFGKNLINNSTWSYYVLFVSPFVKKNSTYVDPDTFEIKRGPTRVKYQWRWRKDILPGQKRFLKLKAVCPVD